MMDCLGEGFLSGEGKLIPDVFFSAVSFCISVFRSVCWFFLLFFFLATSWLTPGLGVGRNRAESHQKPDLLLPFFVCCSSESSDHKSSGAKCPWHTSARATSPPISPRKDSICEKAIASAKRALGACANFRKLCLQTAPRV